MAKNNDLINSIKKMVDGIAKDKELYKKNGANVIEKNGRVFVYYTHKKGSKK